MVCSRKIRNNRFNIFKEIALGLIKDQIQEKCDKVLKLEFDLEDSYIDSLVYQIISRR